MTLRLTLMRHAKSDWDDPMLDDHDRILNKRGRASADALGTWLKAQDLVPERALVSSAVRTRETFRRLMLPCPVTHLPELYHASPDGMLEVLRTVPERNILLVGHNPGIGLLALGLAGNRPEHPRFRDYPTGATTVLEFDGDSWRDLVPLGGTVTRFIIPRELVEQDNAPGT